MQIKRIENGISRQGTFSKRRSALFKKAKELSLLCDAEIAIILFSCNAKLYQWSSNNMKDTLAKYEKISGISSSQTYRREMLAEFGRVQGESQRVAAQIRCREGAEDFLDTLSMEQLLQMEEDTHRIVTEIRQTKKRQLDNRCEALRRKAAYLEQIRLRHIHQRSALHVCIAGSQERARRDRFGGVEHYNNLMEGRSNVLTEISDYEENNRANQRMFQCNGYHLAVKANRNNAKAEEEEGCSTVTAAKFSAGFRR